MGHTCFALTLACLLSGLPKVELRSAVEEVVKETPEYRCMQSQFSVLYNESLQLKAHLDEARTLLHGTRGTHQRQVELIEVILNFSVSLVGMGASSLTTKPAIPSPALSSLCDCLTNGFCASTFMHS